MAERYIDDDEIGGVTYESDRHRVEAQVRDALGAEGLAQVDVVCIDGEVTLAGVVADRATRERAVKVARGVFGVRDVVDRIRVGAS
jgi:osmotically-inducible protein OsmY